MCRVTPLKFDILNLRVKEKRLLHGAMRIAPFLLGGKRGVQPVATSENIARGLA
jgi:hypothetical protein